MAREYHVDSKKKQPARDKGIVAFCAAVSVGFIFYAVSAYCGSLRVDMLPADVPAEDMGMQQAGDAGQGPAQESALSRDYTVEPSSIGSMQEKGEEIADIQNALIRGTRLYASAVSTAISSGYDGEVPPPDGYEQLLASARPGYMPQKPSGLQGEIWSDCGVWEFNGSYGFSIQTNKSVPAVWTCYSEEDEGKECPYAIVTAKYLPEEGTFVEAKLSRTAWYPKPSAGLTAAELAAGMGNDPTVSADQCGDESAAGGSNDDGDMTQEQLEVREKLQQLLDAENAKKNSVTLTHEPKKSLDK